MNKDINIRKALVDDVSDFAVIFDQYRIFYKMESDVNRAKEFLFLRMTNFESEIFVAECQNELIGFAQLYPLFSSTRMQRLWLLNDLFVIESYRGLGVSKSLIDISKKLVIETNACGILLETAKSNIIGNRLYPVCGFEMEGHSNFYFWANH